MSLIKSKPSRQTIECIDKKTEKINLPQLPHLPRYLKAMLIRGERAHLNPAKDAEKYKAIAQYANWRTEAKPEHHETLRWMFEEYCVSIFAPELGTAQTVSPKRIDAILEL